MCEFCETEIVRKKSIVPVVDLDLGEYLYSDDDAVVFIDETKLCIVFESFVNVDVDILFCPMCGKPLK